jgi:hypothetical protein
MIDRDKDTAREAQGAAGPPPVFVTGAWTRYVVQPLLIAVMVTAQFAGLILVLGLLFPDKPWLPATILAFVFALEAVYAIHWMAANEYFIVSRTIHRIGELVFIVVVVRVVTWLVLDTTVDLALLRGYVLDPLAFFDASFTLTLVVTVLAWQRGLALGTLFHYLAIPDDEAEAYARATRGMRRGITRDRTPLLDDYFRSWLWGGAFLLLCGAVTTLDLSEIARSGEPLRPEMMAAFLAYFLIGIWLLSQGRLSVMNERWMIFGFNTRNRVARSWRRNSLRSLVFVLLLSAFVPTGSTVPISGFVNTLLSVLFVVFQAVYAVLTLAIAGFVALLGFDVSSDADPTTSRLPPLFKMPEEAGAPSAPDPFLAGSMFWFIVGTVAVVAIYFFLRDRGYGLDPARAKQLWRAFVQLLIELWYGVSEQVEELRMAIASGRSVEPKSPESDKAPRRFIRINALPPRQQVRYFYLSVLRHAGKRGVERRHGQTPLEYIGDVTGRWPEAEEDIGALTAAFLKARYSRDDIAAEEASTSRTVWKRLRALVKQPPRGEARV